MAHDSHPENIDLTVEDFTGCGWEKALANGDSDSFLDGYASRHQAFSDAAKVALSEGHQAHGKALELLADACYMMLSPDSPNEPFRPFMDFRASDGGRTGIPDDFSQADITLFAEILETIDDPWLKARLADLVWLGQEPREVRFALEAIDAYRSIPLEETIWKHGARDCWTRAIRLAHMLGIAAGDRLIEMERKVIEHFHATARYEGIFALDLSNLLKSTNLGSSHAIELTQGLESIANAVSGKWHPRDMRDLFQAASDWHKTSSVDTKQARNIVRIVESLEQEAEYKASLGHFGVAANLLEKAIQTCRTIPRSERPAHGIDQRIAKLQARLNKYGKNSLDEMGVISASRADVSEIIEDARNAVKGKEPIEALKTFANLHRGADVKKLREKTVELLHKYPLRTLFPGVEMSRDGRVIAKQPAMSRSNTSSNVDEIRIDTEMTRNHCHHVDIVVRGLIQPALDTLLLEHRLRRADFINLAKQSPVVPPGRELLFGKALFAGYERDFVTALHILTPQIEHMARFHLKQAGAKTTNLDSNGIETENSLSTIINLPETERIFGESLSFEIKALFCSPVGPNLRNTLAHGLLDDEAFQSVYAIYAWWLGLKLVFNNFWNALRKKHQIWAQSIKQGVIQQPFTHQAQLIKCDPLAHRNKAQ